MRVHRFSERFCAVCREAEAHPSHADGDLASALLAATEGRGLPTLAGWRLEPGHGGEIARHARWGIAYADADGVRLDSGVRLARDPFTFLERMALAHASVGPRVHLDTPSGHRMLAAAKLRRWDPASDDLAEAWLGDGCAVFCVDLSYHVVFESWPAMSEFLALAADQGIEVHVDGPLDSEVFFVSGGGEPEVAPVYGVDTPAGRVEIALLPHAETIIEICRHRGRVVSEVRASPQGLCVRRSSALRGSAALERFGEAVGAVDVPATRMSFEELGELLEAQSLPFFDAWFDAESTYGGLRFQSLSAPFRFGVRPFREREDFPSWIDEIPDTERGPEPTIAYRGRLLLPVAALPPDESALFVAEDGVVLVYRDNLPPERRLVAVADSLAIFFERLAMSHLIAVASAAHVAAVPDCDAGWLAEEAKLSLVPEASDTHAQLYAGGGRWIWRQTRALRPGVVLAAEDTARLRSLLELAGGQAEQAPGPYAWLWE